MKISKKIVLSLTITLLTVTLYGNTSNASTKETLTGSGRWETAIKISQAGWKRSENAVLVNDNSIVDALSATPFAKLKDAPILLTQNNKLDSRTKVELKRLGVKNVYLIGGENTLESIIEEQLKKENISSERISGNDRYETSLKLAENLDKEKNVSSIVVVNGESGLADAVSVGAAAAQENMPIILSNPNSGTKVSEEFIKEQNLKKTYIIGGTYSISNSIEQSLPNTKRISGNNRNETNAKVIQEFYKETSLKNLYVTKDGMKKQSDLIDSLAVGVLAAKNNSPVALVGEKLESSQKDVVNTKQFDKIIQVGGNGNENVVKDIIDMQEETKYTVETVEELNVAIKKSDINDVIKFIPKKKISDSFKVETDKNIKISFEGDFSQNITINMPNGEVSNSGGISADLVIKDIKKGTLINEGRISGIDIYDSNGCEIENKGTGEIWLITIINSAKDVYINNSGDITKISNDCSSVNIRNSGSIDTVSGSKEPAISGNRPKINNTEKVDNDDLASGLHPSVVPCTPYRKGHVMLTVPQSPKKDDYDIYYRVVSSKPSPMKIDAKVNLSGWNIVVNMDSFSIEADNGSYIEVVEVNSNRRVERWGKTNETSDGLDIPEVAKGLSATISSSDNENIYITTTNAKSGCNIYYRIVSSKPEPMNVGDTINSVWKIVNGNSITLKVSDLNGKYLELAELDNLTSKVTRWGTTNQITIK
ncbi:TPA: cell wall-binding repeat-containing protein [Clostridioides difficile]